mgnify:CR=1 FL=1
MRLAVAEKSTRVEFLTVQANCECHRERLLIESQTARQFDCDVPNLSQHFPQYPVIKIWVSTTLTSGGNGKEYSP